MDNPGKLWCLIAPNGKIEFIDWDIAEGLAEEYRLGTRRDQVTTQASLAVAVREYVLSVKVPTFGPRK